MCMKMCRGINLCIAVKGRTIIILMSFTSCELECESDVAIRLHDTCVLQCHNMDRKIHINVFSGKIQQV